MLQQLLRLIQSGEFQSTQEIAGKMNVSVTMIQQMAMDLARKGYLEEILLDCSEPVPGCADCPMNGKCQTSTRQWILTQKGKAAVLGSER